MARPKNAKIDLLRSVPLFAPLRDEDLRKVAALCDELDVDAGAVLVREGAPGDQCFVIAGGTAEASLRGKLLATLAPGDVFGEMSLIDRAPRSATVTAVSPMKLLVFDPRSFQQLLEEVPSVSRRISAELVRRLRSAEDAPKTY